MARRTAVVLGMLALSVTAARAADRAPGGTPGFPEAKAGVPQVPGDDIFGFTSPTDVGAPGDRSLELENDARVAKASGRYGALNQKLTVGSTFAENWWIGLAGFAAWNRSRSVPGLGDLSHGAGDGVSVELAHRVVERSRLNPFAVTLSVEPRWDRIDPVTGRLAPAYGATFKLFTDAVVQPDRLFWAANVQFATGRNRDPANTGLWSGASGFELSTALAWQLAPRLFAGAEVRWFSLSPAMVPWRQAGQALFGGPTLLWKPADTLAVNVTWQPQLWGRSQATPGRRLDLDDFERQQVRLKFAATF